MLVDPTQKVMYISTPKCASTSYEAFFKSNGWVHDDALECLHKLPTIPFTFIRDPNERFQSALLEDLCLLRRTMSYRQTENLMMSDFEFEQYHNHVAPMIKTHFLHFDDLIMIPLTEHTKEITNLFFKHHDIDLRLDETVPYLNTSKEKELERNDIMDLAPLYMQGKGADDTKYEIDKQIFSYLNESIKSYRLGTPGLRWNEVYDEKKWNEFKQSLDIPNDVVSRVIY